MKVTAFVPGKTYPTISITGAACALNCRHCKGRYLEDMYPATTPSSLYSTARNLVAKGAKGILISGGFTQNGFLPVRPFLPTIKKIKKDFDVVISLHPGLVDEALAKEIRMNNVDVIDFELIVDSFVIEKVKGLKKKPSDYLKSLEILKKYGPTYLAPHLPIGFGDKGILKEKEAIDSLRDYDPYLVTFLYLIPAADYFIEDCVLPKKEDLVDLFKYARKLKSEIALGCMRPSRFKDEIDQVLIERCLVDRVAIPRNKIIKTYNINTVKACCSLPREFLFKFVD